MVLGRVAVFLLVDAGKVDPTRDAFVIIGTLFEDVDGQVTSTRDAFDIVAPLANVVDLVTFLVEVGARSPSQDVRLVGLLIVECEDPELQPLHVGWR